MRRLMLLAGLVALPARARSQHLDITVDHDSAAVGDVIVVHARLHLDWQQQVVEPVPRPMRELPEGVRLLSADSLRPTKDGTYEGTMRFAFYRTGRQQLPSMGVLMGFSIARLQRRIDAEPVFVTVVTLLPPLAEPPLKDIRPLAPEQRMALLPLVVAALLGTLAAVLGWQRRRRRRRPVAPPQPMASVVAPPPPTPHQLALAQLEAIERAGLAERDVARHYAAVAEVLRTYLAGTTGALAPGATTEELLRELAAAASGSSAPLERRMRGLFVDADLVKFARVRPTSLTAHAHLSEARAVLDEWGAVPAVSMAAAAGHAAR